MYVCMYVCMHVCMYVCVCVCVCVCVYVCVYVVMKLCMYVYYTSREDTLIPLDENHVSKLLATCASAGSLTAVTIRRISNRCKGDDVLAPVVKVPFHDSLYC